jgi:hypothetical protein
MIYFSIDLLIRYTSFKKTSINAIPFLLHLKKRRIKNYILMEKFMGAHTLTYCIFFIPLALILLLDSYGPGFFCLSMLLVFLLITFSTLIVLLLKVFSSRYISIDYIFYITIVGFFWMIFNNKDNIESIQNDPLIAILQLVVALIILVIISIVLVNKTLTKIFYLDY